MIAHRPHGFIADIYFDSENELKKAFSNIQTILPRTDYIFELNIRVHWQPSTLKREYYNHCLQFVDELRKQDPHLNIFFKLPLCIGDKAQYATFPDCASCVFFEADWCQWPRQSGRGYYTVPQAYYSKQALSTIRREAFEQSAPLTWYYPTRRLFHLAARQLEKTNHIVDFGSGNGFVAYLLSQELTNERALYAVDPYVKPQFQDAQIISSDHFPEQVGEGDWSLFSSLADFYVPLDLCMQQTKLPRHIVMFLFPNSFGLGGFRTHVEIKNGQITKQVTSPLFDLDQLPELGYRMLYNEHVESHFHDNTEFRIYSLDDQCLTFDPRACVEPYAWEQTAASPRQLLTSVCQAEL